MLKIISKFAMDILPSVVATIIGAYIVNHYIVTKPAADAPVAAAASSVAPKKPEMKAEIKNGAKPSGTSADVGNIPQPGVTAKGISEKAMLEQTAAERPASAEKPAEKSADKPAETASIPVETRRHPSVPHEKTAAKAAPVAVQPAAAPVVAAPTTAPAVEAAIAPDEHRDANDLARAAIERLRGETAPRPQEAARVPDPPRAAAAPPAVVMAAPAASAPLVRPLPPPIMVSTPATDTFAAPQGSSGMAPSYPSSAGIDDPRRPVPPADIPEASPPLDLRADAVEPPRHEHGNVAQDMLLAAKSVFHAVLPK
jgi:hypothetical protein